MQGELLQTDQPSRRFAKVALPIPVNTAFTYSVPADMDETVFVGARVEVPFGRRVLSGIVTEITDTSDVPRIKPIRALFETWLPDNLLSLSVWIADYYGCTPGEAMQSVLPPSMKRAKLKAKPKGMVTITDAEVRAGGETSPAFHDAQKKLSRAKKQLALYVELTSAGGEAALPTILSEWGYARTIVDGLEAKGFIKVEAVKHDSPLDRVEETVTDLTDAQTSALDHITTSIRDTTFNPVLLYGVTGSGKTEVYLRAAREVLAAGGGCIVLVPEIGLLPQATARYRRMFGDKVAIIHSRLTGPERFDIWERVQKGEFQIVVGPRSAIFMPVKDLRLVIVDEEQDDSYKQDDKPRYHARNIALVRGQREGLTVVLGSATPSAESLRHANDNKYVSLRLPERVQGNVLPEINIIDMRSQEDKQSFFSPELIDRLERNIESGQQSIIFLNKRGHARFIQCNACGWVGSCKNCDISLTFHRVDNTLKCHFCGFTRRKPARCDDCSSSRLFYSGIGTQRVELDLQALFPGASVLRMDADTTSGKEGHRKILEEFSTGDYPILLGTQMVTKGHHFPGVSLVGVLYAEESLNFPDFRSAERTFQTLTQVAGRSGRGDEAGEVIIQTYMPEHYVFQYLAAHDYDKFMAEELSIRKALRYPPFSRLVLASCSSAKESLLHEFMEEWAAITRKVVAGRDIEVLGPTPPLVARIKNRYREQMLMKGAISGIAKTRIMEAFEQLIDRRKLKSHIDLRWDVDPESFF